MITTILTSPSYRTPPSTSAQTPLRAGQGRPASRRASSRLSGRTRPLPPTSLPGPRLSHRTPDRRAARAASWSSCSRLRALTEPEGRGARDTPEPNTSWGTRTRPRISLTAPANTRGWSPSLHLQPPASLSLHLVWTWRTSSLALQTVRRSPALNTRGRTPSSQASTSSALRSPPWPAPPTSRSARRPCWPGEPSTWSSWAERTSAWEERWRLSGSLSLLSMRRLQPSSHNCLQQVRLCQ